MSNNIILSYSILFAAVISLISAVYVSLTARRIRKQKAEKLNE